MALVKSSVAGVYYRNDSKAVFEEDTISRCSCLDGILKIFDDLSRMEGLVQYGRQILTVESREEKKKNLWEVFENLKASEALTQDRISP